MADAFEILARIRELAGENETLLPEIDTLETEVRGYADRLDGATAQLSEKETGIAALMSDVSRLKSQNYDLVIQQQPGNQPPPEIQPPSGIAGLFLRKN